MANYWNDFSVMLPLNEAQAKRALEIYQSHRDEDEDELGYNFAVSEQSSLDPHPHALWIHSEEGGTPDDVIEFVTAVGKELGLKGKWGFQWGDSCSIPRLDGFGGGAAIIELGTDTVKYIHTDAWLTENLSS